MSSGDLVEVIVTGWLGEWTDRHVSEEKFLNVDTVSTT